MRVIKLGILSVTTALLLSGCGGGGSSASTTTSPQSVTGTLLDNVLKGVKYVNGTISGYTDENGNFPYTSGIVEFYIGSIKIGQISSMPSDKKVYIQDVVGVERTDTTNETVVKIATLLQSLDSDSTTDKIEIPQLQHDNFQDYSDISQFADYDAVRSYLSGKGFSDIRTQEQVRQHLNDTLVQEGISSDITAPTLVSSSVSNGDSIGVDSTITLTFSESIPREYLTSNNFVLEDTTGNVIDCNISGKLNIITITPRANLDYSTAYELTLNSGIKDFADNSFVDSIISFNTLAQGQTPAPSTIAPVFTSPTSFNVDENQTSAFRAVATNNQTYIIVYSLSGADASYFNIHDKSGNVTFINAPDYETKNSYSVIITAMDTMNTSNASTQAVTVNINDLPETVQTPVFSVTSPLSTPENSYQTISVAATSASNSTITYALSGTDSSYFDINTTTGVIGFKNGMAADYETKNSYLVTITATDALNRATTEDFTINITNISEITFKGKEYGQIVSPNTGRVWLDRNLGASNVCYDKNDTTCNGDFYQWGRLPDGHELSTSNTTTQLATTYPNVGHGDFISTNSSYDWLLSGVDDNGTLRAIRWASTASGDICPVGYKVPTFSEFVAEIDSSITSGTVGYYPFGYHSFLKLAQNFTPKSPAYSLPGSSMYWTLDRDNTQEYSKVYDAKTFGNSQYETYRQIAMPIRCVGNVPN